MDCCTCLVASGLLSLRLLASVSVLAFVTTHTTCFLDQALFRECLDAESSNESPVVVYLCVIKMNIFVKMFNVRAKCQASRASLTSLYFRITYFTARRFFARSFELHTEGTCSACRLCFFYEDAHMCVLLASLVDNR